MPDLNRILSAKTPLTLAGVPTGFEPWLLADLARAAKTRAVLVAPDEAALRAIAATAPMFAPELEALTFPAWDCLPYDRASPTLQVMAERMATLHQLQQPGKGPQLLITTANAAMQRTLTPFRIRQLVARLAPGERIGRDRRAEMLQANGYRRTETVADAGEFAVRGGLVDLFPSGEEQALRLDFFGDEIESVRPFDPADQRTTGRIDGFTLLPASEMQLDEESIKRFRSRYRERFGATATGDPLYQAISDGRRLAGMEHWLPLLEDKLATLFDHLGEGAVLVRDAGVVAAAEQRFEAITDYHANRVRAQSSDPGSYRPLPTDSLYLKADDFNDRLETAPAHRTTPFHEPESATVLDFQVDGPRDFAPERASGVNIYEAVVEHLDKLRRDGRKPVLASYSTGARERLTGLLKDHGLTALRHVDNWHDALGAAVSSVALIVLPLDHGFTTPDIALLTEQDMLGDRLVRRKKRRKSAGAFLAAIAGHQVAVICPTTLLARQHYQNFVARFEGFPLNVGRLSRLVGTTEAKATKEGLAAGTIDIVIGTHAILSKGIVFKRLGLVIVDEEQRFGVTHKERLKALKSDVHVLPLTATPLPRTLQMAMSGLRELSVIQTPPVARLAVRTYVMPWDPVVLREALLREHYRGGQSFFVTPRIKDLPDIEEVLREQVPEVRYVVAHGQMAAGEVEERMSAFYDKKFEVLVSTTIVESGLDIPSANTMIFHRADRFGLAQLYQLRGRVGRSKTRAYAYFTTPGTRTITEAADKRLQVLANLESLGAGIQLASHDLDIRGAGNLLGDEQSGHIKEVGFELYQSMLEDAILEAKSGGQLKAGDEFSPQISVDAPIMISDEYVPDLDLRMGLYRRMNEFEKADEIEPFAAELIDRFGKLPEETENLLKVIEIKLNCRRACVVKLDVGPKGALVHFHNDHFPDLEGLIAYVQRLKGTAKLRPDSKLVIA